MVQFHVRPRNMSVVLSAAGLGSKAIRIAEEFDRLLRTAAWLRECLEAEMSVEAAQANGKPARIGEVLIRKWQAAVNSFDTLTAAKIRFDKNAKALADSMTPEEEMDAVRLYIRSLPPVKRRNFLAKELEFDEIQRTPV